MLMAIEKMKTIFHIVSVTSPDGKRQLISGIFGVREKKSGKQRENESFETLFSSLFAIIKSSYQILFEIEMLTEVFAA
ncbi:hypothetical protein V6N13_086781 [Hibiscus sabdariffa]|uniref:Uncharacterized protein n=1 Tax=Hibiscus sabdariffa TaxID=183260 RepID=A0ABR2FU74_9ROSI